MKVILLEEVKGKGGEGDVVEVSHGFAVNFLLPRGMAQEATKGNLKQLEARKHNIEKRELARTTDASALMEALDGKSVTVRAKVGEEGQLFGSVTTTMVADAIKEQIGVEVDRKKVDLHHAIKTAGEHEAIVSIYREVKATVKVNVIDLDADEKAESGISVEELEAEDAAETAAAAEAAVEAPASETIVEEAVEEVPVEEAATDEPAADESAE